MSCHTFSQLWTGSQHSQLFDEEPITSTSDPRGLDCMCFQGGDTLTGYELIIAHVEFVTYVLLRLPASLEMEECGQSAKLLHES